MALKDIETGVLHSPDEVREERWQVFRVPQEDEYAALKEGIRDDGIIQSLILDANMSPVDGHTRLRAWRELVAEGVEIPPVPYMRRLDLDTPEKIRFFARKLNMQRRQLTNAEKREVIYEQLEETPTYSDGRIAYALGVSRKWVTRLRLYRAGSTDTERPDPERLPKMVEGRNGVWMPYDPYHAAVEAREARRRKLEDAPDESAVKESMGYEPNTTDPSRRPTTREEVSEEDLPDERILRESGQEQAFHRIITYMERLSHMDPQQLARVAQDRKDAKMARQASDDIIAWFGDYRAALLELERGQLRLA